jgi:site-specific DNA recombinase
MRLALLKELNERIVARAGIILDRSLFDAVQTKLAASANVRQLKLRASPSILAGRIFDDRGTRMTPTHTNKNGARYRYYISHACSN